MLSFTFSERLLHQHTERTKIYQASDFFIINIAPKIEVSEAKHIALHPEGKCQESNFPGPRLPTSRKYLAEHLKFLLFLTFQLSMLSQDLAGTGRAQS